MSDKIIIILLSFFFTISAVFSQNNLSPPFSRQDDFKEILHGVEIIDPYRWLEDQVSPETRGWIDAQNAYTLSQLSDQPSRIHIKDRLGELLSIDQISSPTTRRNRYFFWKKRSDEDLWSLYIRRGMDGKDELLLDPHELSPDHTTSYTLQDISEDGKLLLYGIRQGGEDEIPLPGLRSILGPWGLWDNDDLFFEFRSYIQPQIIFRYDQKSGNRDIWAQDEVDFNPDLYLVEQVWYKSKDGEKIPMFLVFDKNLKRDGTNPTLLYGYGGFNISETPQFSTMAALWIENGGIYAVANILGGGEFGEDWHRAGMLENKQNVFDDFISRRNG